MKWSFKIARLWGIDVYVHYTFLALLAYAGLEDGFREGNFAAGVGGMIYLISLFVCVLLHEYGHALAARRYGILTSDITLLPIGGIARLARLPDDPKQELVIAMAGPLVNVAIAGALAAGLALSGNELLPGESRGVIDFAQRLLVVNLSLLVFNLLPAFPMDGGRVLRALLALVLGPVTATRIAAGVGKVMAAGFAAVALYFQQYLLLLIALFVWMGAGGEARAMVARSELRHRSDAPQS
jgi:Zn-dependent protease